MLKKPKPRFLRMSFSALAVVLLLLSACSTGGTPTTTTPTTSAGTPVKGGTWIDDLFEEPDSLITNASNETFAAMMMYALYAPMLYSTPQGQVMSGLVSQVTSWANGGIGAESKTWKFTFKSGLKWSDGQPLDARDMDFTWKLWKNPKFGAINTIAVTDITSADVSSDNLNPSVVSGPFMMSESKPTDHYTMVRNPMYYQAAQGLPYLDKIIFRITPDQNTILKDLQAGTPHSSWFLDVSKALVYQSLSNYQLDAPKNSGNFEAMYFDFHNKVLANNPEVRQAMSMAVDQLTLIQVARRGLGGQLCVDHAPTQVPGHYTGPCPKFDLTAANALLDSKGWKAGSDGVRTKNGQRLEFQYSTTANNLWRADDELINQQNFKKIGIKIDIQNYPASTLFGTFLTDGKPGVYDIVEYETAVGLDPDDAAFFQTGNPGNTTYYSNPALDALYKQEQATADPTARQAIFDKIHQIYLTDFPFIVEFASPDIGIHKKGTENYQQSLVGAGEDPNVWLWWCAGGTCP